MDVIKGSPRIGRLGLIFSIIFIIYNANLIPPQDTGDVIPAEVLPFSIIGNHTLYLDSYYYYYLQKQSL